MYGKNEAFQLKRDFWTAYGSYMKPIQGATGQKVNWVNYKTGIRHIYFRTDVNKREAGVAVAFNHPSEEERLSVFAKMEALKPVFTEMVPGAWYWQREVYSEQGLPMCRILCPLENVNIFNREDWPQIIPFFKGHMVRLDAFWAVAKDHFQ